MQHAVVVLSLRRSIILKLQRILIVSNDARFAAVRADHRVDAKVSLLMSTCFADVELVTVRAGSLGS